jgi:peptide-methionine (S)-S-oxide reductase
MELTKIAFGGGCHWCTEAVFQHLIGVEKVAQGWVSSVDENETFSEAVIVHFDTEKIDLQILIEIHLQTHKSTSNHSMRNKYRSAIYYFSDQQKEECKNLLQELQVNFENKIITQILKFKLFKHSLEGFHNYYQSNPDKPFCQNYLNPKLKFLLKKFTDYVDKSKVKHFYSTT